jgi:Gram-negative bacterial TonB protein C-terminal
MTSRLLARAGIAAAALALTLAGCRPAASPTPTPTPARDAEAARAARAALAAKRPTIFAIDTIGTDSGSVSVVIVAGRTLLTLRCPFGTFVVAADSARFAAWADTAGDSPSGGNWIRTSADLAWGKSAPPPAPEAVRLVPVVGPVRSIGQPSIDYVVQATNGAWDGAIELDQPAAARLLAALQAHHDASSRASERLQDAAFEFEVERPVGPGRDNPAPPYPVDLRDAGVSGQVLMQFVVDTTGRAELPSIRVLSYSRPEFARSVRAVLPYYRFVPALVGRRLVRQIVQQPFEFVSH